jgi:hypothetical protein
MVLGTFEERSGGDSCESANLVPHQLDADRRSCVRVVDLRLWISLLVKSHGRATRIHYAMDCVGRVHVDIKGGARNQTSLVHRDFRSHILLAWSEADEDAPSRPPREL